MLSRILIEMPAKHRLKSYIDNSWYHIYNRGVEKRIIFQDAQDYHVFLSYLRVYLEPKDEQSLLTIISSATTSELEKDKARKLLRLNNFADSLSLVSYCLMPNHFHLLLKQTSSRIIDQFMNSLGTRYTMYFNKKYHRVGSLFQGVYKAVEVDSEEQLIHLSRYIHRNPIMLLQGQALQNYEYSSYGAYIGSRLIPWIQCKEIQYFFSLRNKTLSYRDFVEEGDYDLTSILVKDIALEE